MLKFNLDFWVYLACMIVPILLMIGTIFFSIRVFKTMTTAHKTKEECIEFNSSQEFKDEIRYQMVYQQVNSALEKVMAGIDEQRTYIQNLIAEAGRADLEFISQPGKAPLTGAAILCPPKSMAADTMAIEDKRSDFQTPFTLDKPVDSNPYDQIVALLKKGLDPDKIADQLGICRAEVDLFMQLRIPKEQDRENQYGFFQATA